MTGPEAVDAAEGEPQTVPRLDVGPGIRVALLLPLSGPEAELGRSMLRAAQIALFDIAADDFVLMPLDTAGTPEGARKAARVALANDARLLLGPLFADSVSAVAPLTRAAGVNMVAFSNNRRVAGDRVFLIGLLPKEQVFRIVSFAAEQGALRFAVLAPATEYGRQVVQSMREALALEGGILTRLEYYAADGSDISDAVRRLALYDLRRSVRRPGDPGRRDPAGEAVPTDAVIEPLVEVDFDALLVPVGGPQLRQIAALLPFYDVDTKKVRLLGVASWRVPGLGREPPLVGAWFAAPESEAHGDFERRFASLYKAVPSALSSLAYDAAALAAVLARAEGGADFGVGALTSPNGYAGTAGIFRFLPSGEVQRGMAVLEVTPWSFRVLSRSPESFEDPVE